MLAMQSLAACAKFVFVGIPAGSYHNQICIKYICTNLQCRQLVPIAQFIMNLIYKHASIWLGQLSHNHLHDTLFQILLDNLKKMHKFKVLEFVIDDKCFQAK